ncbi:MAG: histidinol dehydrogenase [bacterium]|nr:MAG: histidinol dehydrogenase [bacterium]
MKTVKHPEPEFEAVIRALETRGESVPRETEEKVSAIVEDVRKRGDAAVAEYTLEFDRLDLSEVGAEIEPGELRRALRDLPPSDRQLIEEAAESIREFHLHQLEKSWTYEAGPGILLGQKVTAIDRVGLYVPGGTAAYPSSVLMNAVPARVAGVNEVIMAVPTPGGIVNGAVLAAAAVAQVDRVFRVGGAQAIASLAYGTETIPRVDKIVGPGNIYVALAKKIVFGAVDIDMIAGPSEILVLADRTADPRLVAADLLSQAEHDPLAYTVLVTDDGGLLDSVERETQRQLALLPRRDIAAASLEERGYLIQVPDLAFGAEVSNRIAPEHLELMVDDPDGLLNRITHAGAVFLGSYTPEALGDYMAGPNHVLPTGGTARFFSPLGAYDFLKRSSVIRYDRQALERRAGKVARFARMEGLEAHARAVDFRVNRK